MKKIHLPNLPVIVLLYFSTIFVGCGGVGMLAGGRVQTYMGSYSIMLEAPREDILDIVAEVGRTMGYSVSGLDRDQGTISLSSGSSMATTGLLGKSSQATIYVAIVELGKKLDTRISLVGNFGKGTQKAADKLFEDFKTKLLERINSP